MKINTIPLLYNAYAHFAAKNMYPDGMMDAIHADGMEGYKALCWMYAELATQAELARRRLGWDAGRTYSPEDVEALLLPTQLVAARARVMAAINKGMRRSRARLSSSTSRSRASE